MRLNSINPKDNPMEEVLYCFGGDTDSGAGGSAGDFEGTNFGGDTATAGGDLGGSSDRDRIADEAGVSRNTMVGSGPAGGNVVRSADGSPVKSARAVEEEARKQGVSVAEINDRINKADRSVSFDAGFDEGDVADTSVLDEIAYSFDAVTVDPTDTGFRFFEETPLPDVLGEDYSAVFDQPTTRAGQIINVDPDASFTQSPAGQVESIKGGRSQSAKTASDDTGFRFFEETPLVDVLGDDPYQLKEESRFDLGLGRTVPKSPEPSGADLASTPRSRAIEDLVTAYQSSVFPDQLLEGTDPQNLIDQVEGLGTVGDQRPLSIPEIQNITAELLKNPANRDTVAGFALADVQASTSTAPSPAEPVDLATLERQIGYPSSPIDLDFLTLANKIGPDPTVEQIRELYEANPVGGFGALTAYAQKEADQGRSVPRSVSDYISGKTDTLPSSEIDKSEEFGVTAREMDDAEAQRNRAIAAAAVAAEGDIFGASGAATDILRGYDEALARAGVEVGYKDQPDDLVTVDRSDTTTRTPEALQSLQEANARRKAELGLPEDATTEDIQKAINAGRSRSEELELDIRYSDEDQATAQRNPVMGFSPYEQLSTIDPETGERVALDFRTSLGGPDNFGAVDFGSLADPINVFGVDVPTGLGVAEGALNALFDPTGTTERAVYDYGVRSVDGRVTGLDTGIDLVTDGTQQVIGGYDRDRNVVYATEGNLFNPALSDFFEEKRRIDDLSGDDGGEPQPLAGGLEILPQSLSAYDFGSSSFDPFPTGTGTGTGSIDSLPAIGDPAFDFMRDFGAFTLSPQAAQAPMGTYSPEYLAPISELGEGERERLAGLLGTPLGAGLGLSSIDTAPSPIESAEALIKGLGSDQSV